MKKQNSALIQVIVFSRSKLTPVIKLSGERHWAKEDVPQQKNKKGADQNPLFEQFSLTLPYMGCLNKGSNQSVCFLVFFFFLVGSSSACLCPSAAHSNTFHRVKLHQAEERLNSNFTSSACFYSSESHHLCLGNFGNCEVEAKLALSEQEVEINVTLTKRVFLEGRATYNNREEYWFSLARLIILSCSLLFSSLAHIPLAVYSYFTHLMPALCHSFCWDLLETSSKTYCYRFFLKQILSSCPSKLIPLQAKKDYIIQYIKHVNDYARSWYYSSSVCSSYLLAAVRFLNFACRCLVWDYRPGSSLA